MSLACVVTDVAAVFSFVGAFARNAVFFLFPAAIALATPNDSNSDGWHRNRAVYACLFVLGSATTILGVIAAIINVI